jgi:Rrf2 family protein
MHVTAKADYAVRAIIELANSSQGAPRKVDDVAQAQGIPVSFLENILTQLRSSGIVRSQRGPEGGYWLAQPADELNLANVIRAVEGPLVGVRGQRPEEIEYVGSAESLQQVWIALRANLRKVLEQVTVADVAAGKLPREIIALTREDEAWHTR